MSKQHPYRVLVVDDDSSVLITYRLILERQGYQVSACGTSREAIEAIQRKNFDAILCDYSLEEQHTGLEVIRAARSRRPDVPAILLTGYATNETADEAAANNIAILYKPIEIEEFLATTSKMLRRDNEPDQKDNKKSRNAGAQDGKQRRPQQQRGRGRAQRRSPGGAV